VHFDEGMKKVPSFSRRGRISNRRLQVGGEVWCHTKRKPAGEAGLSRVREVRGAGSPFRQVNAWKGEGFRIERGRLLLFCRLVAVRCDDAGLDDGRRTRNGYARPRLDM
jgi:hypothetical protein